MSDELKGIEHKIEKIEDEYEKFKEMKRGDEKRKVIDELK
jgi:hypothetical protein